MMSDKLPIFKDGECPYCHYDTHAIGNEPLRCELCGWIDMKPKTHEIKILERPYIAAHIGIKPWEYRKDDRCYNVGDSLCLYLGNKGIGDYEGFSIKRRVTYILRGPAFGIPEGYCIMTTEKVQQEEASGEKIKRGEY